MFKNWHYLLFKWDERIWDPEEIIQFQDLFECWLCHGAIAPPTRCLCRDRDDYHFSNIEFWNHFFCLTLIRKLYLIMLVLCWFLISSILVYFPLCFFFIKRKILLYLHNLTALPTTCSVVKQSLCFSSYVSLFLYMYVLCFLILLNKISKYWWMVLRLLQHNVVHQFGNTCREKFNKLEQKTPRSTCLGNGKCFIIQLAIILEWTARIW